MRTLKMILFFIGLLTVLLLPTMVATPALAEVVQLGVGQSAVLGGGELRVVFESTLNESRCPEGAVCFWEGDAVVRVTAEDIPSEPVPLELHTNRMFVTEVQFHQYVIELVQLAPYPQVDDVIDPNAYVVTLDVRFMPVVVPGYSFSALKGRF